MKGGNRTPRKHKPESEKSRHFQFRLLPKTDQWLIDLIDHEPAGLRKLIVTMAEQYTQRTPIEPIVVADAYDVVDIKQIVQYIADKLESGEFARAVGKRRKREVDVPVNDAMRSMLDRHFGGGLLDDDDE